MPVAVHLVEALALVTLMGMITCVSLGVVVAHQTLNLTILFIEPAANILDIALMALEKMLVGSLVTCVTLITVVGNTLRLVGLG